METLQLFEIPDQDLRLGSSALVLRGFAWPYVEDLLLSIIGIQVASPFRHMVTPGGFTMSVGLTNCGALGWTTDRKGYRYTAVDPDSSGSRF
jgi:alkylated DNA repair protein (DNA oxidative demethylase)